MPTNPIQRFIFVDRFEKLVQLLLVTCLATAIQAGAAPELHWVSSGLNNRDITFSPDGNVLLTTVTSPKNHFAAIAVSTRDKTGWTPLEIASFSGTYQDIEAMFTPDGRHLYFSSKRPRPNREGEDWDIWRVAYDQGQWSEPENLGEPVNSSGDEFYPSIAANGNLYFTAERAQGAGSEDIYRAIPDGDTYLVQNLGPGVNTSTFEFNAFIAPDESYLLFGSQRREGEIGGGDIYISRSIKGEFQSATLLGQEVNTTRLDYCPSVFAGRLYFTSERLAAPIGQSLNIRQIETAYTSPGNGLGDIYSVPFLTH